MRNLKKVLSLSLALVMLLGLMVVGAGAATTFADLKDKDEISENYAEAVDLLTALGVLEGNENDEFMPTGTLTREAAAKIVAYLALGVDAAEKLSVTSAPFKDVAANRWSAGYIAYCANVGIIDGDGKGSFYPTQEVTGYQFAKMLLGVLGYGAKDEYVGTNWALNVATDGVTVGLFSRLSNVGNTAATREEAAQLAFNALTANMVTYSELFGTYSAYTDYTNQTLLGTKAANIFKVDDVIEVDDYGFNYRYWKYTYNANPITADYMIDTVLGTVTSGTIGAMYRGYGWNNSVEIVENGNTVQNLGEDTFTGTELNGTRVVATALRNNGGKAVEYTGQTVYVVDSGVGYSNGSEKWNANDGSADKLIVVTSYLGEVTKVNAETATAPRNVNVKVYIPNATVANANITVESDTYEKGDYILVDLNKTLTAVKAITTQTDANALTAIGSEAAEVVSGATVTAYYKNDAGKTNGSVTAGGVKYNYNGIFADADALGYILSTGNPNTTGYSLNKGTYNFYLDQNGNVIGAKVVEAAIKDFAYIVNVGHDSFGYYNVVDVLLSDGTRGTYTVSSLSDSALYDSNNGDATGVVAKGEVFGYSFDTNRNLVLTELDDDNKSGAYFQATNVTFTKGGSVIGLTGASKGTGTDGVKGGSQVVYATDTTVFVYLAPNGSISRYEGKNNAPTITSKAASIAYQDIGGVNYATYVVLETAPEAALTTNYVIVTSDVVGNSQNVNGSMVYYYNVVKDGVATTIAVSNASGISKGQVYVYAYDADLFISDEPNKVESGQYTLATAPSTSVQYNFTIDVLSNSDVIVDSSNNQFVVGGARIIDTTVNPIDTEATLVATDTVVIVYEKVGSLNVAKDVFIVNRYNKVDAAALAAGGTITANTYVEGNVTLNAGLTVNAGATLYVKGNVNTATYALDIKGNLVVDGPLTVGAASTVTGNVTVKGAATLSAAVTGTGKLTVASFSDGTTSAANAQTSTVEITAATAVATLEAIPVVADKTLILEADSTGTPTVHKWFKTAGATGTTNGTEYSGAASVKAGTYTGTTCYYETSAAGDTSATAWLG